MEFSPISVSSEDLAATQPPGSSTIQSDLGAPTPQSPQSISSGEEKERDALRRAHFELSPISVSSVDPVAKPYSGRYEVKERDNIPRRMDLSSTPGVVHPLSPCSVSSDSDFDLVDKGPPHKRSRSGSTVECIIRVFKHSKCLVTIKYDHSTPPCQAWIMTVGKKMDLKERLEEFEATFGVPSAAQERMLRRPHFSDRDIGNGYWSARRCSIIEWKDIQAAKPRGWSSKLYSTGVIAGAKKTADRMVSIHI